MFYLWREDSQRCTGRDVCQESSIRHKKDRCQKGNVNGKKKYCVNIVRYGCIFVEAESEAEAMHIADRQETDTVSWSDDWDVTDAEESTDWIDEEDWYVSSPAW